jgi:hypothetical protein
MTWKNGKRWVYSITYDEGCADREHLKASISATPAMDQNSLYMRADDAIMAFR